MRYYVVWKGRTPGIYDSWAKAKEQTHRFKGARFKGFDTSNEAEEAFAKGYESYFKTGSYSPDRVIASEDELLNSIIIDVKQQGEDRDLLSVVSMADGEVIFEFWVPAVSNKRLGMFFGALKALEYCALMEEECKIVVTSKTVYYWLSVKKKCTSKFLYLFDETLLHQLDVMIDSLRNGSLPVDQIYYADSVDLKETICVG